jgi:hypothetical protein
MEDPDQDLIEYAQSIPTEIRVDGRDDRGFLALDIIEWDTKGLQPTWPSLDRIQLQPGPES